MFSLPFFQTAMGTASHMFMALTPGMSCRPNPALAVTSPLDYLVLQYPALLILKTFHWGISAADDY